MKARGREFKLKTPTSVLGVRGTEFFVRWQKESSQLVNEQISVLEGIVEVTSLFDNLKTLYRINGGEEFRVQGEIARGIKDSKSQFKLTPKIDQFNAAEQKELESATKIEPDVFSKELKWEDSKNDQSQNSKNKIDKFIVAVLTDDEGKPAFKQITREMAQDLNNGEKPSLWGTSDRFGGCGGRASIGSFCSSFSNDGFPIYQSVAAGM